MAVAEGLKLKGVKCRVNGSKAFILHYMFIRCCFIHARYY